MLHFKDRRQAVLWVVAAWLLLAAGPLHAVTDGVYEGTTSQGESISITVSGGAITNYVLGWSCGYSSGTTDTNLTCPIGAGDSFSCGNASCPYAPYQLRVLLDGTFSGETVTGTIDLSFYPCVYGCSCCFRSDITYSATLLGPPVPEISINDVSVTEGDSGTTAAEFEVTRSFDDGNSAIVEWDTSDGTAGLHPRPGHGGLHLGAGSLAVTAGAALGGAFGLEVTLGGPCAHPNELTVPGPTTSGTLSACVELTAAAVEVVAPGAAFTAGRLIRFGDDFAVAPGVDFSAGTHEHLYPFAYVVDQTPANLDTYGASFEVDLDNLALDPADELHHLNGVAADGTVLFRVVLLRDAPTNENRLVLEARLDSGSYVDTASGGQVVLPAGGNAVELSWQADHGNGHLLVSVNGTPFAGLTALDNGDGRLESVHWGAVWGQLAATTGSFALDEYSSLE